ncbi:MAG: ABC transporter ATP-binding protein [Planctomycetota bacterium]|nr:ABC transporter ATP-binding protein [Planctomycetota bacterium]
MGLLLSNVKKTYVGPDGTSVPVIDIQRLELPDAQQVALIGTSGSGKTTLLHMIAGILVPDSGSVIFGHTPDSTDNSGTIDLTQLSEPQRDEFRGRHIGYIFQTHHLLPGFTALENVLLGMTFTGRAHDPAWARQLLSDVGLADRLNYKPQKLSVGQQQRVAVARALANRPRLVLADEPTGALDAGNAQQVLDLIRKLCRDVGASLLLVSHDLDIARQLPTVLVLSEINRAAAGHLQTSKP